MSSLRRGVQNSDNISRGRNTNNQTGEMFRTFQDIVSPQIANRAEDVVGSMQSSPIFGPIMEGYEKVEPYLPDVDVRNKRIGYDYERPMGPGIFSFGGEYDFDDNQYGLDFGYKYEYDEGGIASLPKTNEMGKTPMTDEQKDYLYDYMLDFMMKQRMREQQEMEGRIPPFNYEGLEV